MSISQWLRHIFARRRIEAFEVLKHKAEKSWLEQLTHLVFLVYGCTRTPHASLHIKSLTENFEPRNSPNRKSREISSIFAVTTCVSRIVEFIELMNGAIWYWRRWTCLNTWPYDSSFALMICILVLPKKSGWWVMGAGRKNSRWR